MIPMNLESTYDVGQPFSYVSYANGPYFEDILFSTGSGTGLVWLLGDKTNKLHYILDEPVLSWQKRQPPTMKSWYDAGYINKDVFANKVRSKDSFVQGKSAVGFGNSIDIQSTIAGATANGWEVELRARARRQLALPRRPVPEQRRRPGGQHEERRPHAPGRWTGSSRTSPTISSSISAIEGKNYVDEEQHDRPSRRA